METTLKTNRLAIVSFVSGLIGLITFGVTFFPVMFPSTAGNLPEPPSPLGIVIGFSRSIRDFSTFVALATGIFALWEIKRKGGLEKGRLLAWVGILLGSVWILFRVAVGLVFILALFFSAGG